MNGAQRGSPAIEDECGDDDSRDEQQHEHKSYDQPSFTVSFSDVRLRSTCWLWHTTTHHHSYSTACMQLEHYEIEGATPADFLAMQLWPLTFYNVLLHVPGAPKKYPLNNFANFFMNYGEIWYKNFTHWLLIQLSVNVQCFITLSTELTKLCCFNSLQLSSWDVIKNCLNYSRQRKRCKCEHFFE